MSKRYITLIGGPYTGMKRRSDRLPTYTFQAKGETGFYSERGIWVAKQPSNS